MKIFKATNLNGKFNNNSIKYLVLIHFTPSSNNPITLQDENGEEIESFNDSINLASTQYYPDRTGTEDTTTGAISYNSFTTTYSYSLYVFKNSMQKILIPPGYSVNGIGSGLFLELENIEELRGLI